MIIREKKDNKWYVVDTVESICDGFLWVFGISAIILLVCLFF